MTVHAVQVRTALPDVPMEQVRQGIQDWVDAREEVLPEQRVDLQQSDYPPDHLLVTHRFSLDETRSDLLDAIENALQPVVPWYVILYHACYADEEDPEPCRVNERREFGNVPEGVA